MLLTYAAWQQEAGLHMAWYVSVPVLFGVTVLLSLLSYRYFEKPMNRLIKSLLKT